MNGVGAAAAGPAAGRGARETERAASRSYAIEIVDTAAGFEALKPEWDALFSRAGLPQQVSQDHDFLRHWVRHYLDRSSALHIVVGRQDGVLAMVWPLVRRRRLGLVMLQFMGLPVAQFGDILLDPESDVPSLAVASWAAVECSGADLFFAQKVRADAAFSRLTGGPPPLTVDTQQSPFACLKLRAGTDGPGSAYSPRERSSWRRRLKRLAERGELALRSVSPGAEAEALARRAVAFKLDRLNRSAVLSPTMADARFSAFFADVAADPDSSLRIATIERAGRPIGIDLSFDCKGTSFGHVLASDPDCEHEGVGSVLIHHVLAAAAARGSAVFDMLAPADPYKLHHTDGQTVVHDLAFAFTLRGRLYGEAVLKRARPLAKELAKKLPAGLVRGLTSGR
ncbi:GNAT family N-acetyltransferase [Mesorhizobium sp. LHD-90]|uniref:GNAT family N-acetyltransferase n=1 Tax=Mesorhizobium sp. LHD-90 TaxID=3071414 RepID=UPI0027DFE659|nr:GNAT family N-acetyltransferase [Mesorhizobium sp. LHD-90]MDQ6435730.1 GNAT family N-acetyltransferase [Mesorhizobium sp. LHD-90]